MDSPTKNRVGRPVVLVVEDEPGILALAHMVLERAGYDVTDAADGAGAVAAFGDTVAVVILDVMLPDMTGWEVFAELQQRRPDVRVVLTTGNIYDQPDTAGSQLVPTAVLPKPYRPADLVTVVGRVLAAR